VRIDIPEGFFPPPSLFSYGRILSIPKLNEWYAMLTIRGVSFFLATGKYDFKRYSFRFHQNKEVHMSIKLAMEIQRAHERLDALEKELAWLRNAELSIQRLENEIKAMKARAGKNKELAEI
jgi:hypothetical protein